MKGRWLFLMAWRDSRRSRSRLFLFMASIICGIAALVAIYSFGYDLKRSVDEQAATLVGADLSVNSEKTMSPAERTFLDSLGADRSREERFGSMVLFPRTGGIRLVQVRALSGSFPYYGHLETTPASADQTFRKGGAVALVDNALMLQFNARAGDSIKVGNVTFLIAGALNQAPGQTGISSSVAPIVYIPLSYMAQTGLSQKGSRIEYAYYYKFPKGTDVDQLVKGLEPRLEKDDLRYETVETRKENTGRFFGDLTNFLSLVGFIALLLGCIGVASAVHIYIREKTATIAIMRCLGVTAGRAFAIYLIEVVAIGLIGAIIGSAIGSGVQVLLPMVLKDFLPFAISSHISGKAIAQGICLGAVISVVFGMLPLLSIRKIPPLFALRSSYEQQTSAADPLKWLVYALMLLFIGGFAYLQLGKWLPTLFFTLGIVGAFLTLAGVARSLMAFVRVIIRPSWNYLLRQGFTNLYRPNNQTVILMVAIGLSTALISVLFFTQGILIKQLGLAGSNNQANMILFDIQSSQEKSLDSLTVAARLPVLERVPVITVRINSINGKTAEEAAKDTLAPGSGNADNRPSPRNHLRAFNEELRVTYRASISTSEKVTAGKWTGQAGKAGEPVPVSLEDGYARHIGAGVGDRLSFNVQGTDISAIVGSIRKVEWGKMQTNFRIVFPTGVLEDAPQFHVLLTHTPNTETAVRYQQAVVRRFPNVSIIDLGLILSILDQLLEKINDVIHFMAAFSVVTGFIVLIASVRNSKYQRIQESVLLRTLGAVRRQVFTIAALEYLFLGLLAALTGMLLALAGSWLLARYLFKLPFTVDGVSAVGLFLLVSLLTMLVGLLNSRGILNKPTLEILRTEA